MAATLELQDIVKTYPGTVALKGFSARWDAGRIHALIGRNGAGKSTLVKILTGAVAPTSGTMSMDGHPLRFRSPADARNAGIAAVYQELSLLPELTVMENIHLGRMPRRQGLASPLVDWKRANEHTRELFARLGLTIPPGVRVGGLPVARQQLVEIAKAMSGNPAVLLLDEPTSALSYAEAEGVFALLRTLAANGVLILYITHRLGELPELADTITSLRDGVCGGTFPAAEVTPARMVTMMFGEDIRLERVIDHEPERRIVLQARTLTREPFVREASFDVRAGEVLGIAGLIGAGRTELLRLLAGADTPSSGHVLIDGTVHHPRDPGMMKRAGLVMAPENRKDHGLVTQLSTRANLCLANLPRLSRHGLIAGGHEDALVQDAIGACGIAVPDQHLPVASLSGGNQQKVVLGKWLATDPRVLLLDEPTRGIDLAARAQIMRTVLDLSRRGLATVVVSSELEELLLLCHRILIMRRGRIVGEVDAAATSLDELLALCMEPT